MKHVDIKQLSMFCTLIDCQSMTETARRMQVTTSAVSQTLTRLRDVLGDPLCVREHNRYVPTPFARGALGRFREIVDLWGDIAEPQAFDPATSDAHMVIACAESFGEAGLADFYHSVTGAAPHMTLDIHSPENGLQDLRDLREGSVELVCGTLDPSPDARDIRVETVRHTHLTHCCLNIDHPRLDNSVSLSQYLAEEHIVVAPAARNHTHSDPVDRELRELEFSERMKTVVNSWALCAELLARTDRLVTVSHAQSELLVRSNPRIKAIPLPTGIVWPSVPINMVWHERTQNSRPHRWLRAKLREFMQADRSRAAPATLPALALATGHAAARPLRPAASLAAPA